MPTLVKKERLAFMAAFAMSAGMLLLDRFTALEINNQFVLFLLLYVASCNLLLMAGQYLFGVLTLKFIGILFALILGVWLGLALLTWKSDWKTQTVIYRNAQNGSQTIEYRMRSRRFGQAYDRQIVRRERILPLLDITIPVDTATLRDPKWVRVDERTNEMNLPGDYVELPCD